MQKELLRLSLIFIIVMFSYTCFYWICVAILLHSSSSLKEVSSSFPGQFPCTTSKIKSLSTICHCDCCGSLLSIHSWEQKGNLIHNSGLRILVLPTFWNIAIRNICLHLYCSRSFPAMQISPSILDLKRSFFLRCVIGFAIFPWRNLYCSARYSEEFHISIGNYVESAPCDCSLPLM